MITQVPKSWTSLALQNKCIIRFAIIGLVSMEVQGSVDVVTYPLSHDVEFFSHYFVIAVTALTA